MSIIKQTPKNLLVVLDKFQNKLKKKTHTHMGLNMTIIISEAVVEDKMEILLNLKNLNGIKMNMTMMINKKKITMEIMEQIF